MTGNDIPAHTTPTDSPRDGTRSDDSTSYDSHRDAELRVSPALLQDVCGDGADDDPAAVLSRIADDLSAGEPDDLAPDEQLVIGSLDELLTALVALQTDGTHGTGLIDDVAELFGVEPSPGTVYPRLHDLETDGTLERYDLVQTKQYGIDDADAAASRIEDAMYQHLLLGLFLSVALDSV